MVEVVTSSLDVAEVGEAYSEQIETAGGTAPYTFSRVNGNLPAGLSLGVSGLLSGTPTQVGVYPMTVRVDDSVGGGPVDHTLFQSVQSDPGAAGVPVISMTPSVTTGVAPLAVFFDSSATTAPGVAKPFHHLGYHWDWGDRHSRHRFTTGPVAAHVFSEPGNYIVLHTVIKDDATAVTQAEVITVTDPDTVFSGTNTICFSNDSDFTGAPAGAQEIETLSWNTALAELAIGKRLLFKRGDTFTSASGETRNLSGDMVIGAFGTPAGSPDVRGIYTDNPIVDCTGNHNVLSMKGSGLRWMDMRFTSAVGSNESVFQTHTGRLEQILCYRLHADGFHDFTMFNHSVVDFHELPAHETCFVAECHTVNNRNYSIYAGGLKFGFIGNRFEESIGHHTVRIPFARGCAIDNNQIWYPKTGDHALKLNAGQDRVEYGDYTENVVVCGNEFKSEVAWIASVGPMDNGVDEWVRNVIIERNRIMPEDGAQTGFHVAARHITIRNNEVVVVSDTSGSFSLTRITQRGIEPLPEGVEVYNNTYYNVVGSNDSDYIADVQDHTGDVIIKNNLMHAPNGTAGAKTGAGTSDEAGNLVNPTTPGFTNPGANDFSLTASSDALGAGVAVPVWFDYQGYTRLNNSAGAHDFQQASLSIRVATARFRNRTPFPRVETETTVLTLEHGALSAGGQLVDASGNWVDWIPNQTPGADAPTWPDGSYKEVKVWLHDLAIGANSFTEIGVDSTSGETPPTFALGGAAAASLGNFLSDRTDTGGFDLSFDIDPGVARSNPRSITNSAHGTLTTLVDGANVKEVLLQVRDAEGRQLWEVWLEFYRGSDFANILGHVCYSDRTHLSWTDTLNVGYRISGAGCFVSLQQEQLRFDNPNTGGFSAWDRDFGGPGRIITGQGVGFMGKLTFLDPADPSGWTATQEENFSSIFNIPCLFGISDDWRTRGGYGPRGFVPTLPPPQFTSFTVSRNAERNQALANAIEPFNSANVGAFYHDHFQGNVNPSDQGQQTTQGHAPYLSAVMTGEPAILERITAAVVQDCARGGMFYFEPDNSITTIEIHEDLGFWSGYPFTRDSPGLDGWGKPRHPQDPGNASQNNDGRYARGRHWTFWDRQHFHNPNAPVLALLTGNRLAHQQCASIREHLRSFSRPNSFRTKNITFAEFESHREVGRTLRSAAWIERVSPSANLRASMQARINSSLDQVGLELKTLFGGAFPLVPNHWVLSEGPGEQRQVETDSSSLVGLGFGNAPGILYWQTGIFVDGLASWFAVDPATTRAKDFALEQAENCIEFGAFEDLQDNPGRGNSAGGYYNFYHALAMTPGAAMPNPLLLPPNQEYEPGGGRGPMFPINGGAGQASHFRVWSEGPRWMIPTARYVFEQTANNDLKIKAAKILKGYYQTYRSLPAANQWWGYGETDESWIAFAEDPWRIDYDAVIGSTSPGDPEPEPDPPEPGGGGEPGEPGSGEPGEPEPEDCTMVLAGGLRSGSDTLYDATVTFTEGECTALVVYAEHSVSGDLILGALSGGVWTIDFDGEAEGLYDIVAECQDPASPCATQSQAFTYVVAECVVSVVNISPSGNDLDFETTSSGTCTAFEAYIATATGGEWGANQATTATLLSGTWTADLSGLANGTYYIRARCTEGPCAGQEAFAKFNWESGEIPVFDPGNVPRGRSVFPVGGVRFGAAGGS